MAKMEFAGATIMPAEDQSQNPEFSGDSEPAPTEQRGASTLTLVPEATAPDSSPCTAEVELAYAELAVLKGEVPDTLAIANEKWFAWRGARKAAAYRRRSSGFARYRREQESSKESVLTGNSDSAPVLETPQETAPVIPKRPLGYGAPAHIVSTEALKAHSRFIRPDNKRISQEQVSRRKVLREVFPIRQAA